MPEQKADISIRVEHAAEVRHALREFPKEVSKEHYMVVKELATTVRDMAAYEANDRGYNDTGDLIAGLQARSSGTTGSIRDTARHEGYNYPGRLEYQNHGRGAFIRPAVEKATPYITRRMDEAVARVIERFNRGAF
jgi:hypothetical protein